MPRPKSNSTMVRITFPDTALVRFRRLADALAMDVNSLIRVMASVQLVQWEAMYLHPEQFAEEIRKSGASADIEERLDRAAAGLFPELDQSPERKIEHPGFRPGGKPRSEDLVHEESLPVQRAVAATWLNNPDR